MPWDRPDDAWIDATAFGDPNQVQYNPLTGKWRHRAMGARRNFFREVGAVEIADDYGWKDGDGRDKTPDAKSPPAGGG